MESTHFFPRIEDIQTGFREELRVQCTNSWPMAGSFFHHYKFLKRETLILSHTHTHTQAAKAEFNPADIQHNQDIYLYVQSPRQTNSTETLTHDFCFSRTSNPHLRTNTLGDNALQWIGVGWGSQGEILGEGGVVSIGRRLQSTFISPSFERNEVRGQDSAHIDGATCVCEKIWLRTERWSLTWGLLLLLLLSLLFFLGFAESKPSLRKGAGLTSGVQRMSERERKVNKEGWCK